jgi:aldehyde:ferredoxin oxidoreductase
MYAWHGRALEIDLATGQNSLISLSPGVLHHCLGGRGLAGYLLRSASAVSPPATPLFALACGPFCGTEVETGERLVAVFRSPLTGGIFDLSSGCSFAGALKRAGFDALVIKGVAPRLSCLSIACEGGRLTAVLELAGVKSEQVLAAFPDQAALVIGPAGENRVRYASVIASDGEPLGRGGLGAVFGQMQLKAVCCSGSLQVRVADPAASLRAKADIQRLYNASPYLTGPLGIGACGTAALLDLTQARRMLPTANFKRSFFEHAEDFSAFRLKQQPGFTADPCPGCRIACRKRAASGELPEYDSLAHFSALIEGLSLNQVLEANRSCRSLGLDPISAAVVLATCFENQDKSAASPNLPRLLEQIAHRQGAGAELADGLKQYLRRQQCADQPDFTLKGLELSGFDPRGAWGMALSMAVATTGDYGHALAHYHELLRKPVPTERLSLSGKARIIQLAEEVVAACDSLAVCRHTLIAAGLEEYAALLSAISGIEFDPARLVASGRQTLLRERWLNQQYGFSAADDLLPPQFFSGTGQSETAPSSLNLDDFMAERRRYYALRGLNAAGQLSLPPEEPA